MALLTVGCEPDAPEPPASDTSGGDAQITDADSAALEPCQSMTQPMEFHAAPPGPVPGARVATVGDFDGDGATDIAFAPMAGGIFIYRNDGDGKFLPWSQEYSAGADTLFAANIDQEDGPELLIAAGKVFSAHPKPGLDPYAKEEPSLVVDPIPGLGPGATLASRDLDGNGPNELIVASPSTSAVYVLAAGSDGSFSTRWMGSGPFGHVGAGFAVIDLDGDGRLDLATGNGVAFGNGDATFQEAALFKGIYECDTLVPIDLTGDGVDDLLCSDTAVEDPSLAQSWAISSDNAGALNVTALDLPAPSSVPRLVADLDGDGIDEIVCAGAVGVAILRPASSMKLELVALEPFIVAPPDQVFAFEANGDGHLDLALFTSTHFLLLLGDGTGHFVTRRSPQLSGTIVTLRAADLDADGRDDLIAVAGMYEKSVVVLRSQGDGTFDIPSSYPIPKKPEGLAFADVTGDGDLDVVVAGSFGNACFYDTDVPGYVLAGLGNGKLSTAGPLDGLKDHEATAVAAADVDGDDVPDIVVAYGKQLLTFTSDDGTAVCDGGRGHEYQTHLSLGGGALASLDPFVPKVAPAGLCNLGKVSPRRIALADMTGDGVKDLVVGWSSYEAVLTPPDPNSYACRFGPVDECQPILEAYEVGGGVFVAKGDGHGAFPDVVDFRLTGSSAMALGDLNGDGLVDLTFGSEYNELAVLRGLGTDPTTDPLWATANPASCTCPHNAEACPPEPPHLFVLAEHVDVPGNGPPELVAGRFDSDMCDDLAVVSGAGAPAARLVIYRGAEHLSKALELSPPSTAATIAAGDFDGDGRLDLAVGGSDGRIAVFLNATSKP